MQLMRHAPTRRVYALKVCEARVIGFRGGYTVYRVYALKVWPGPTLSPSRPTASPCITLRVPRWFVSTSQHPSHHPRPLPSAAFLPPLHLCSYPLPSAVASASLMLASPPLTSSVYLPFPLSLYVTRQTVNKATLLSGRDPLGRYFYNANPGPSPI